MILCLVYCVLGTIVIRQNSIQERIDQYFNHLQIATDAGSAKFADSRQKHRSPPTRKVWTQRLIFVYNAVVCVLVYLQDSYTGWVRCITRSHAAVLVVISLAKIFSFQRIHRKDHVVLLSRYNFTKTLPALVHNETTKV